MTAIGMALAFAAFTGMVYGYCMIRGYDVTPSDLFKAQWPGVTTTPPSGGHQLGTIQGSTSTTNPGQLLGPANG